MHKRNASARVVSAVMSVAMVMSGMSVTALAEETTVVEEVEEVSVPQEAEVTEEAVEEEQPAEEVTEEEDSAEDEELVEVIPESEAAEEGEMELSAEEEEEFVIDSADEAEIVELDETETSASDAEVTWPRYGTMTMSYAEFYSGLVSIPNATDAVSSATTRKTSMFSNADVENITESGYQILGVKNVPVIVSEDASDEMKARVTFDDSVDVSTVKQYRTVSASGIGAWTLNVKDTVTDATAYLNTSSRYGDYQIEITETTTSHLRNSNETYDVGADIMGVVLTCSNGNKVGLTHMKNIWVKTYEVAFSADRYDLATLVGNKVTAVTYIMQDGVYVYDLGSGLYIKEAYDGDALTGSFSDDGTTFTLDKALSGLTNPTIKISYSAGHHNTVTLLSTTAVAEGQTTFTLETAVPDGTTPTVTISSDGLTDVTVSYPIFGSTKTTLSDAVEAAKAVLDQDSNYDYSALKEKLEAAEAVLAGTESYSSTVLTDLQTATEAASIRYGTMTMTYKEFYSGMVSDSSTVDTVSSATKNKSTMFVNADASEVTDSGYQIYGVKNIPVKVMPSTSDELKARVTYSEDTEAPKQYYTLDKNGIGSWMQNTVATVTDATATLSTSSSFGDYEIQVNETSSANLRKDRTDNWPVGSGIVGIVLETSDGQKVGLTHMKNIWIQPYKLAFSLDGSDNTEFAGLTGKTIVKITYLLPTESYVYDLGTGVYLKPKYSGSTISGSFNADGTVFTLDAALDSSLTNAKISISYSAGHHNTTSLLDATEVGTATAFTLTTAVPDEVAPTVTISSDSSADITVTYPMLSWQKEELEDLVKQGTEALAHVEDSVLSAHVAEAQTLLANTAATATEASDLISELSELIESALANMKHGMTLDSDGIWRYYQYNVLQSDYTGLVEYQDGQFYVVNGVLDNTTGLVLVGDTWYALHSGQVQSWYTGLTKYDGEGFYIENGKLLDTATGLVEYQGGQFVLYKGWLQDDYKGLYRNPVDGKWYYIANGQVQNDVTGVVGYDGGKFYVKNGEFQSDYNGSLTYDGVTYNVVAGQCYA